MNDATVAPPLDTAAWLVSASLTDVPVGDLVEGTARRLLRDGVPVARIQISFRLLHPLFDGMSITWLADKGVEVTFNSGGSAPGSAFRTSPFFHMLTHGLDELHRRLDEPGAEAEFPIFAELKARGATDYLALSVRFGAMQAEISDGIIASFATTATGGFAPTVIPAIRWVLHPLALALRVAIKDRIARTALETFHGGLVGERILSGAIKRGSGERMVAALWYSDLRNSTGLADQMPVAAFLDLLNRYFECTAGAVIESGGQVLDMVGDAVVAMFPVTASMNASEACTRAVDAAALARRRLGELHTTDPANAADMEFGIGIHFGEFIFGNAGTPTRLKFSVIGRAVNEVARTAEMTKRLARPVLVSHAAAQFVARDLEAAGDHILRGIATRRRLWALPAQSAGD